MKKFSSLIATLIVALVAFAQTPSATITMTIEKGQVILTPTPTDAHVYCLGLDADYFEDGTNSSAISTFFDDELEGTYESADDINLLCPSGNQTICISDWMTGEAQTMFAGRKSIILAAVVAWDAESNAAVRLSDVVFVDTIFATVPTCGADDEPVKTIEAGQYYISSTLVGETDEYLLTTSTNSGIMLPATKYVDENTPKEIHQFTFVAVDGQETCFTIQDHTGAFLALTMNRWRQVSMTFAASKPETGAIWKVTVKDEENHTTIANTEYSGDLHCMKVEGEIAYFFGDEPKNNYNLPVLTKVQGTITDSRETIIKRQVSKTIENGQLILHIDGMRYNILGISLNH